MPEAVLQLRNVTVRFGGVVALDAVNLDLSPGETLGIIGPNGAGKTTLFDVVSGLRAPTSGTVGFDGTDITRQSPATRARLGLRRTYQAAQVFGWLSVEDNVLAALEWRGGGGGFVGDLLRLPARQHRERDRRVRVREVLELCGIADYATRNAGGLPLGVARLVELARAIVDPPAVLLLDESTSGMDADQAAILISRIEAVRTETGCAMLLIEHDMEFIVGRCDRIAVLDSGRLLAQGTPAEIQAHPDVRRAYLGEAAA
ncbi:ABC transporter ATP-binding protein [Cryptosporangium aurantiacum]|uniref:Amino acid/amide ABC transporter ATP-binding protein 1, HAAT family n=1 Tax=Cryptosporangium aurantiacum TaxID=134849 RepID=A0A1M7TYC8_9ACTN|nr:ATP-binding cassette domain-containing protein [Cryptosporangium aurantiacum]SHN75729.1 amino acid/amide ABC transporter ATP-binding protein 1, HAAT family [Cryptosporangium aurantiacum]